MPAFLSYLRHVNLLSDRPCSSWHLVQVLQLLEDNIHLSKACAVARHLDWHASAEYAHQHAYDLALAADVLYVSSVVRVKSLMQDILCMYPLYCIRNGLVSALCTSYPDKQCVACIAKKQITTTFCLRHADACTRCSCIRYRLSTISGTSLRCLYVYSGLYLAVLCYLKPHESLRCTYSDCRLARG